MPDSPELPADLHHDGQAAPGAAPSRRLAAVMLADVAGYSRQMERDESGTHLRLREVRSSVTDPAITRHHGRIVRNKGDDILVEFASAVEALSCAVEIQRQMAERNRDLAADSRIEFRIGINLGDILIDGSEIAGDGVNVAARLEALAAPGEVAISQAVREQVRQLVGVRLIDAGQHKVKNISRPIRVYKVSAEAGARRGAGWSRGLRRGLRNLAAAAALVVIAVAVWRLAPWPASRAEAPRQSLAVLPVAARAPDAQTAADTLTHDLTTALSQTLAGVVVAPSSVAQFRGQLVDARQAGQRLNVRYVVESTVLSAGESLRVSAQLVSAETGAQLWSSTLEAPAVRGEPVPLEVLGRLTDTVATEVRRAELARPLAPGQSPDAYLITLRATMKLPSTADDASLREVQSMYEQALALDPGHGPALSGMAMTLAVSADRADNLARAETLFKEADSYSLRAVAAVPKDHEAWRVRATVLQLQNKLTAADEAIDRALSLNPYANESHAQKGLILYASGRADESIAAFDRAIRLNPEGQVVGVHLFHRCRAQLYLGRYAEAIESCV
ncbi:MAG: adenylate/guanylate cyclase domain-containing protein, partial [Burkholderiaceae bacterium]|nr:adenylate/guanylate cyclase domain-containing protein [Burkholderiaceae bacterium]